MTNMGYGELAQNLRAEAWGLILAAQAPGREPAEATWMLGIADRLKEVADALNDEAGIGEKRSGL